MHTEHPKHGEGWVLYYLDPASSGVDDHFVGGTFGELPWALGQAKAWLHLQRESADKA
ncbi:hypothetical protein [Actinomycetospora flava]|uniref:Uncharacterized protein n=1 Tax=Actinomycetospora flava TaxID=3129232 RepID=A0ABU8MGV6_9PSEU